MNEQKVSTVTVSGNRVPVTLQGDGSRASRLILSSSAAQELIFKMVGRALATPVKALTIVFGEAYIDISATFADIGTELHRIRLEAELQRMHDVLEVFGKEIRELSSLSYTDATKQLYEARLLERMDQRLKRFQKDDIY